MKKLILFLLLLLLPVSALAETVLPKPVGQGVKQTSETWEDGNIYQVIRYEYKTSSLMSFYRDQLEKDGYVLLKGNEIKTDDFGFGKEEWYSMPVGDATVYLRFSKNLLTYAGSMELYLPEGVTVEESAQSGSSQNTSYSKSGKKTNTGSFQNDLYVDYQRDIAPYIVRNGNGSVSVNLPDASRHTVRCVSCKGTGKCASCHGTLQWRNPYTGSTHSCQSCKNGLCSVCGGTGYWN